MTVPFARAPDLLTLTCPEPVRLDSRAALSAGDTARLWGLDRRNLAVCAARHGALARHVRSQEGALRGF